MVMDVGAYLCNTYEDEAWASLANKNIEKYFNFHDIKLSIVNLDNASVKVLSQYPNICPTIRKMLRYYSFLESSNEYGIFIDLDTVIINPLQNIADRIDNGTNFLKTWKFCKKTAKQKVHDYILRKSAFVNKFFNFDIEFKCSTGFSILNRQFCSDYIKFNQDTLGINITSEKSIKELSKLTPNSNYIVNDESILEIFLSQPMHHKPKDQNYWWNGVSKKYNIIDPIVKNKICYSNYSTDLDLLALLNNDYIFWHLSNLNYKKHLLKFTEIFTLL